MRVNRWIWLIIFLVSFLETQGQYYQIKQYGIDDGLSRGFIYSISQSKEGYLWLGTDEGLFQYDGRNFQKFDTSHGLSEVFVTASYTKDNTLEYFGHYDGSISRRTSNNRFIKLTENDQAYSKVTSIWKSHSGDIYYSTFQDGIFKINPDKNMSSQAFTNSNGLLINTVSRIKENLIALGTTDGVYFYDELANSAEKIDGISGNVISLSNSTSGSGLWCGTEEEGLYFLNSIPFTEVHQINFLPGFSFENIQSIYESDPFHLWISSYGKGIYQMDIDSIGWKVSEVQEVISYDHITTANVHMIFRDREDQYWFGCYGEGLLQIKNEFFSYFIPEFEEAGSESNNINAFCELGNNEIWVGTDNGINSYNPVFSSSSEKVFTKVENAPSTKITALKIWRNEVWIGTEGAGLFTYNLLTKRFSKLENTTNAQQQYIQSLAVDNEGFLWVGTRNGLLKYDPQSTDPLIFTIANGLAHNTITQVYPDSKNRIWLASEGLVLSYLKHDKVQTVGLKNANVNCIVEDHNGIIWFGTNGQGIFSFDGSNFSNLRTDDGLESNFAYQLTVDQNQNLWIGHRNSMSQLNLKNNRIAIFESHEFYKSTVLNPIASFQDQKGNILFGTNRGLLHYYLKRASQKQPELNVHLSTIQVLGEPKSPDFNLELPYKKYNLKFEFQGVSLRHPDKVRFQYILDGNDIDWSEETSNTFAYYPSVPYGNFVFKVKAINARGTWSQIISSKSISIAAPFWVTWWFILICISLLVALVYGIFRYRTALLRKDKIQLESVVRERTEEIRKNQTEIDRMNHRLKKALRGSEARNNALLEAIPDIMLLVSEDGKLIDFQSNEYKELDAVLRDLRGHEIFELFHEDRHQECRKAIALAITNNTVQVFEFKINLKKELKTFEARIRFTEKGKVVFLARDITERLKLEEERSAQQRKIAKAILETQEQERKRFAEDLHDSLGQLLSASRMNLATLEKHLDKNNPEQAKYLENLNNLIQESINEARGISHNLMPAVLNDFGLKLALEDLVTKINQTNILLISLHYYGSEIPISDQIKISSYRVIQETLNNAIKHSKAKNISIQIHNTEDQFYISIEDDGVGFDMNKMKKQKKGLGLMSMENRINALNGILEIESEPGNGTLTTIEIPIEHEGPENEMENPEPDEKPADVKH